MVEGILPYDLIEQDELDDERDEALSDLELDLVLRGDVPELLRLHHLHPPHLKLVLEEVKDQKVYVELLAHELDLR